jgi:hypothetical protein
MDSVPVTFTAYTSTESGMDGRATVTFPGSVSTVVRETNSNGTLTAPSLTANTVTGEYFVTASEADEAQPAVFTLVNLRTAPDRIIVMPQSTPQAAYRTRSLLFKLRLQARVLTASGQPVSGASVTFTAPSSGPRATFAVCGGQNFTDVEATAANGIATSAAVCPQGTTGAYQASASGLDDATPAIFDLTNLPGAPDTVTASHASSQQSATVRTRFSVPLSVTVTNANGEPMDSVPVTFTAYTSTESGMDGGATGTFLGDRSTVTIITGPTGVDTAPPFTANAVTGEYFVTASEADEAQPAVFTLTNMAAVPGAPRNVQAKAENASATVTWLAPIPNDTPPITGYVVKSSRGQLVSVRASVRSATVKGLKNGVSYAFTVTAKNVRGWGPPSVESNSVTPAVGTQLAELKGSDTVAGDWFGDAVAISGTTAVVGAWGHAKKAGRVYVFTKTATGWKQTAELKGSDTVAADYFGADVAISGTTIVVGASYHADLAGRAYVFTKTAAGWTQVAELKGTADDAFGWSVAVSGTTIVVGALTHANVTGGAYVFTKTATGWKQVAEVEGYDTVAGDAFGSSVALSGSIAIIGDILHANSAGRAYVFTKTATGWKQTAELKGSDTGAHDDFGSSVAISGTTVVVGSGSTNANRAYVFTKTATGWKQVAELKGSDTVPGDDFGTDVAISGATVVVGADFAGADGGGRVYVFTKTAVGWTQVAELEGSDTVHGDFGTDVAISGTTVIVGADGHAKSVGRAYVFGA